MVIKLCFVVFVHIRPSLAVRSMACHVPASLSLVGWPGMPYRNAAKRAGGTATLKVRQLFCPWWQIYPCTQRKKLDRKRLTDVWTANRYRSAHMTVSALKHQSIEIYVNCLCTNIRCSPQEHSLTNISVNSLCKNGQQTVDQNICQPFAICNLLLCSLAKCNYYFSQKWIPLYIFLLINSGGGCFSLLSILLI